MPIANNPTGETHAASFDKVYSIGVWSIFKFNNKNNKPIIIERINGFKNKFLIKLNKFTFCFVDNSRKKAIIDNKIIPSINMILATCVITFCWK